MTLLDVFKRFKSYFKDYIPQFALAIIGMLLASGGSAGSAYLVEPVLNKIFVEKNEQLLYLLPYAIIAIYLLKNLGTFMQAYFTAYIGQDTVRRFRAKMLRNLLELDMSFFNSMRTGELMSRTTGDIGRLSAVVSSIIPEIVREIITAICLLGVVIYQSPTLAFFALIVMPAAIYPVYRLAKKMKKISRQSQEKASDISSALNEIYTNIEIVKASNAEGYEYGRFVKENDKAFKIGMGSTRVGQLVSPLMETIGSIGVAVVIIIGGRDVIANNLSVGAFFSFLTALFMLYTPLKRIVGLYGRVQDAVVASERTFYLLDLEPSIVGGERNLSGDISEIKFNNATLSYGNKLALKGINLTALKSQMIALVGASGGGKSSLMSLLMRFYDPNSGSISVDGINLKEYSLKSLRENIGFVSQRVYIFNDTVAHNVAYGREYDEEAVIRALKMANAYGFISELDGGIKCILSEAGANLSGGQRQRIAIARALYSNPQILIFDEATSALDNESEREITAAIEKLRHQKIIFVIAHRLSTVEKADKIAVLSHGKIVGFGDDLSLSQSCEDYIKLKHKSLV
ncbi:ABC transporter ATP-binding protein [Campylobacter sp. 19-13652]|uniref:ABC transporter ATP-binding protein n=1 Tax=Campylobacter sp. 19-13652 TaxID=2840180 RepID=UPI001C75C1FD|nr:ABC transporter ATP-binding protein [Campylobacter sp. 19-13652]BCX79467.1 ABC transporter permease [Campylobacter sp. 19-13652]